MRGGRPGFAPILRKVLLILGVAVLPGITPRLHADCTAAPSINVSAAPHPDGTVTLTLPYNFPETSVGSQRHIELSVIRAGAPAGGYLGGIIPDTPSGTWELTHHLSCAASGVYTYTATAISCGSSALTREATTSYAFEAEPTVSISYDGPDGHGRGWVRVDYHFPNTATPDQRKLDHGIIFANGNGGIGGTHFAPERQGAWVFPFDMRCLPSAEYQHEVIARRCNASEVSARDAVTLDSKPTVSLSADGPDADGQITLNVTYGFPETDQPSQRTVHAWRDFSNGTSGDLLGDFHPPDQFGTVSVVIDAPCEQEPVTYGARATSCNGETTDAQATAGPPPKPTVTLTLLELENGRYEGTIDYKMGQANSGWRVRADLLRWFTADGEEHPGHELLDWVDVEHRERVHKFTFDAPHDARQMVVQATAESCAGPGTGDASIHCGCDASKNPVYFADGNVRVTDGEPLPAIGDHTLVKTYDSGEQVVGLFGRGWTTLFDRRLILNADGEEQIVSLVTATNEVVTFRGLGGAFRQTWPRSGIPGTLVRDGAAGTYAYRAAGSAEIAVFRESDGRLIVLRNVETEREAHFAYDAQGFPLSLTDSWSGTSWNLVRDGPNRRVSAIGVGGRPDLTWSYSYDANGNLTSVQAPGGTTWRTYEYASNRMTASRDALGNLIESHTYDANGYGISSTGPDDEIALFEYNLPGSVAEERVTRVTYKTGAVAEYALRPSGGAYRSVRITGGCASCGANDATYVRDEDGHIVREQGTDGFITTRLYDGGRLISEERFFRPAGCDPAVDAQQCRMTPEALEGASLQGTSATIRTTFRYDDPLWPDRVTAVETPSVVAPGAVRRESRAHHPRSGALAETSIRGRSGEAPETDSERTTSRQFYGDGPGEAQVPAFAPGGSFDSAWLSLPQPSQLLKSVDGPRADVQDVMSFVYYPVHSGVPALLRGHLAATKNAAGHITRYEIYDVFGNATRIVDPNGVATEMTYDTLGRMATSTLKGIAGCTTDPLCGTDLVTERSYDAAGPLTTETKPGGAVTSYTYDGQDRVHTISRGPSATDLREQIEYSYDPLAGQKSIERMLAFDDGAWVEKRRQSFAYDAHGRLQVVTHADAATVHYVYDAADRVASIRDENHSAPNTTYEYDPAGRVRSVTQTLASAAGGEAVTRYGYDLHGNLASVTDPNGNVTSYTYDDFGSLISQNSPVTGITTYEYDAAGQLMDVVDANGAVTTRTYDALGRVSSAISRRGAQSESVTWTYDAGTFGRGRLSLMSDPSGSTSYEYERRGFLARESKTVGSSTYVTSFGYDSDGNRSSMTYPSGRVVSMTFDYAGRPLSMVAGDVSLVTSAAYLPFGPMTEITYGNGTVRSMSYDQRYQPVTNTLTGPGGAIAAYSYGHDGAGNVTSIDDSLDAGYNRSFEYDDLNRLVTANTGASLWGTATYGYDAMGNMLTKTIGAQPTVFSYDGTTPRLTSVATPGSATEPVTYDSAGNELAAGAAQSRYSPRNTLEAFRGRTYVYDGRGIRTVASVPASLLSVTVPGEVGGGRTVTGSVALHTPAPQGGAAVTLASNNAAVTVPAFGTIAEGETAGTFSIVTFGVTETLTASISATYEGLTLSDSMIVEPPALAAVTVEGASLKGGQSASGSVLLNAPAPSGGAVVTLTSSDPSRLSVPASVTVSAGAEQAAFTASAPATVPAQLTVSVEAEYGGELHDVSVAILPPALSSVAFDPASVDGGTSANAVVTLESAPAAGTVVTFTSPSPQVTAPAPVTMSAGVSTINVEVATSVVSEPTSAVLTAHLDPSSATGTLTLLPPSATLQTFTVTPASIAGSLTATGTVTLTAPAPVGGVEIELWPFAQGLVPPFVKVLPGMTEAAFPIATSFVTSAETHTLRARHASTVIERSLQVTPSTAIIDLSLEAPGTISGDQTERRVGGQAIEIFATGQITSVEISRPDLIEPWPDWFYIPGVIPSYEVETSAVTGPADVMLTARSDDMADSVRVVLVPSLETPAVDQFFMETAAVPEGTSATGTVVLSVPAPPGGVTITLTGSRPGLATVPPTVTIPAGETSAPFTVMTHATPTARGVLIRATYASQTRTAILSVQPPAPATAIPIASSSDVSMGAHESSGSILGAMTSTSGIAGTSAEPIQLTKHILYTPELNLMVETAATNTATKPTAYEYVWFAGQPLAQIETQTGAIAWYFNDHLGTPILQTDATATTVWRIEREPYGEPFEHRAGAARHQPLGFPGQEDEGEVSYNIFRWYRSSWARYSSVDPLAPGGLGHFDRGQMLRFNPANGAARERFLRENAEVSDPALLGMSLTWKRPTPKGLSDATNPYAYAADSPVMYTDPLGLAPCLTMSINPKSGYVPAGPPGKTFKGCQYIGSCYGWVLVHEKEEELGCKCKDFCLISIEPATAIPNGPTICFNTPPWWTWSPPLINP